MLNIFERLGAAIRGQRADAEVPHDDSLTANFSAGLATVTNPVSGLGTSRDKAAYTAVSRPRELTTEELDILYEHNHLAARIVDTPPNECARRGWKISVAEAEEQVDPFEDELNRLGLKNALKEADTWSRLYGGGAVLLGLNDGQEWSEPVNEASLLNVEFLRVVDRWELYPVDMERDFRSPHYGLPRTYRIQAHGIDAKDVPPVVHADRVLRFEGVQLPRRLASFRQYWGGSIVQRVWEAMANYGVVRGSAASLVHEFELGIWKVKNLSKILSGARGMEKLANRLLAAAMSKSNVGAMMIDDGEEFSKVSSSVKGLAELWKRYAEDLASAAEMPLTLLQGQAPGGLSTDDAGGRTYWYDMVSARQSAKYEPHIRRVCNLLSLSKQGPTNGQQVEFSVEFLPLEEPTEQERAQTEKTVAEKDALYLDRGVLAPDEVRESRYGGTRWSQDTVLLEDDTPDAAPED